MTEGATTQPNFVRRRPMLVGALVVLLVVVVVSAGIVIVANPFGAKTSATSQQTTWQAITGKIRDGEASKEVALQAFAYAYKIDIPGVQVPTGWPLFGAIGATTQSATIRPRRIMFVP